MWPRSQTSGLMIGAIWRSRSAVGRCATRSSVRCRTAARSSISVAESVTVMGAGSVLPDRPDVTRRVRPPRGVAARLRSARWRGGAVLAHHDLQAARAVDALDAVQLDVG